MTFYQFRISIIPVLLLSTALGLVVWQARAGMDRDRSRRLARLVEAHTSGRLNERALSDRLRQSFTEQDLLGWLGHPVRPVRDAAMRGLGLIGTARSTQALTRSLHSHDPHKQKQAERALRLARRRSHHPVVNALLDRARRLAKRGNADRALDLLTQCATLLPQHPEIHYRTGTLLLDRARYDASEQAFSRALELDPDHFDALLGRALCLFELGRPVEARIDCLQAIKINPNMEEVRLLLRRR